MKEAHQLTAKQCLTTGSRQRKRLFEVTVIYAWIMQNYSTQEKLQNIQSMTANRQEVQIKDKKLIIHVKGERQLYCCQNEVHLCD